MGFRDLKVHQTAFKSVMKIYEMTKTFPKEEKYSQTTKFEISFSLCKLLTEKI